MLANCPSMHGEAFRGKGAVSQAQMLAESEEAYSTLCILGSSSPWLSNYFSHVLLLRSGEQSELSELLDIGLGSEPGLWHLPAVCPGLSEL